jgi:glycosyltransferase involved in cell wall biosynthesis
MQIQEVRTDPSAMRPTRGECPALFAAPTVTLPLVSFVIPTLNEAYNLPSVLPRIPNWAYEVIVVDGHSTDNTVEVARQLRPDVKILTESRRGKGAALQAGFRAAGGDIIIMLDADGSMAPEEAILFLSALIAGADLVKGSRYIQGAGSADISRFRSIGNWGLTQIVRLLYGCAFSDLCYGYMAFWSKHVPCFQGDCDGFEIETLINIRAIQNKLKIAEVASFESSRMYGLSNLRAIPDGLHILRLILRERFWQATSKVLQSELDPARVLDEVTTERKAHPAMSD